MRNLILCLIISSSLAGQSVNAILGDTSWFQTYQSWPTAQSPEQERLTCHLNYVLQKLSASDYRGDYPLARAENLQLLSDYIQTGIFPQDFQHPDQRRPCFIDDQGRLCAVGYLIAESAGRAEAERLNQKFRFHYLLDMKDSALLAWQEGSGLSLKELAMIQPSYGWERENGYYLYQNPRNQKLGLKRYKNNRTVIRARYDQLAYTEGIPFVYGRKDQKWHIFTAEGKRINYRSYDTVAIIVHRRTPRLLAVDEKGMEVYDADGSLAWEAKGLRPYQIFRDEQFSVTKNGLDLGVVNSRGKLVCPLSYQKLVPIFNLDRKIIAWQCAKDGGAWGLIDTAGREILAPEYQSISYRRGAYIVKKDRQEFMLDGEGKKIHDGTLKSVVDGICRYCMIVETDSGFGHFNGAARAWDHPDNLDQMERFNLEYYLVKEQGKYGILNTIGQLIVPIDYEAINLAQKVFFLKKDGLWGMHDYHNQQKLISEKFDTLGILLAEQYYQQRDFYVFGYRQDSLHIFASNGQDLSIQYPWESFEVLLPDLVAFQKGDRRVTAQLHDGKIIYHPQLNIDYIRELEGIFFAYGSKGKEGLWQRRYGEIIQAQSFTPARFDTIIKIETRSYRKFLVAEKGLWGIYTANGDSLEVPCIYDAFYPPDVYSQSQWVYFRNKGKWKGYFYTVAQLQSLSERSQAKMEEWWQAKP